MKLLSCLFISFFLFKATQAQPTVGLFYDDPGTMPGYVLFSPGEVDSSFLIDKCGYRVHTWHSQYPIGQSQYLLADGTLLRSGEVGNPVFTSGGNGGIIERLDWNSNVLWSYRISDSLQCQHHDIFPMPNGNVLAIVWEKHDTTDARMNGRNPALLGASLWSEKLLEIQPIGADSGTIVWQWRVWDHLIQHFDSSKNNYGLVAMHPELINFNYLNGNPPQNEDWLHMNSVDYNPLLDQIVLSTHALSELWIIDHSTTTAQAASHNGGTHQHGGDLLYRWGNPAAYNHGGAGTRKLYSQHNVHWIPPGLDDAGYLMIYNNGLARPGGNYSSVDEIITPVDSAGNYALTAGVYGPSSLAWTYFDTSAANFFFSTLVSGAQRLKNGNTLVDEGRSGRFFELDYLKNRIWQYINPVSVSGDMTQGDTATQNSVFRCTHYDTGYAGLAGHPLTPGNPIELNPFPYTCMMINSVHEAAGLRVWIQNPFGNELVLHADQPLQQARITLQDISGRVLQTWSGLHVYPGEDLRLPTLPFGNGPCLLLLQTNTGQTTKLLLKLE